MRPERTRPPQTALDLVINEQRADFSCQCAQATQKRGIRRNASGDRFENNGCQFAAMTPEYFSRAFQVIEGANQGVLVSRGRDTRAVWPVEWLPRSHVQLVEDPVERSLEMRDFAAAGETAGNTQ